MNSFYGKISWQICCWVLAKALKQIWIYWHIIYLYYKETKKKKAETPRNKIVSGKHKKYCAYLSVIMHDCKWIAVVFTENSLVELLKLKPVCPFTLYSVSVHIRKLDYVIWNFASFQIKIQAPLYLKFFISLKFQKIFTKCCITMMLFNFKMLQKLI